jgi:hypothetical protein
MLSDKGLESRSSPFAGLRPLRVGERIFGRDSLKQELLDRLLADKVCVLYGRTGAGKSSLIAAGLVPDLQNLRFRVGLSAGDGGPGASHSWTILRPADLAQAGWSPRTAVVTDSAEAEAEELSRIVIIDQFEDIFCRPEFPEERRREFLDWVASLASVRSIWLLIGIREDYLASLLRFRRLFRGGLQSQVAVDPLGEKQAAEVVNECLQHAKVTAPRDLIERLVARSVVSGYQSRAVVPVFLQSVCQRWWDHFSDKPESDLLEISSVDQALGSPIGEVGLLAGHVDWVVQGLCLDKKQERSLRDWLESALTDGGERRRAKISEAPVPEAILKDLITKYLIEPVPQFPALVELSVDALVPAMVESNNQWFASEMKDPYASKRKRWRRTRDASHLLRFTELLSYDTASLTKDDFFEASKRKFESELSIAFKTAGVFLVIFLLTMLGSYSIYASETRRAEASRDDAIENAATATRFAEAHRSRAINLSLGTEALVTPAFQSSDAVARALIALSGEVSSSDAPLPEMGDMPGNRTASFLRSVLIQTLSKPMTVRQELQQLGDAPRAWAMTGLYSAIDCKSGIFGGDASERSQSQFCDDINHSEVKVSSTAELSGRLDSLFDGRIGFYANINDRAVRLREDDAGLLRYRPGLSVSSPILRDHRVEYVKLFKREGYTVGLSAHKDGLIVFWSIDDSIAEDCARYKEPCELRLLWLGMLVGGDVRDAWVDSDPRAFGVVSEYGELATVALNSPLLLSSSSRKAVSTDVLAIGNKRLLLSQTHWCLYENSECDWNSYQRGQTEGSIGFLASIAQRESAFVIGAFGTVYEILPEDTGVLQRVPVESCGTRRPLQGFPARPNRELAVVVGGAAVLFNRATEDWTVERWDYSTEGCALDRIQLDRHTIVDSETLSTLGLHSPSAIDAFDGVVVLAGSSADGQPVLVMCQASASFEKATFRASDCSTLRGFREQVFSVSITALSDRDFVVAAGGARGAVFIWRVDSSLRSLWAEPLAVRRHIRDARVLWSVSSDASAVRLASAGYEGEVAVHDIGFVAFGDKRVRKAPNHGSFVVHRFETAGSSLSRTESGVVVGSFDSRFIELPLDDDSIMRRACITLRRMPPSTGQDKVDQICLALDSRDRRSKSLE